jgi:hypothetical protein
LVRSDVNDALRSPDAGLCLLDDKLGHRRALDLNGRLMSFP